MLLHTNEPFGSLQADQGTCGVNRRGTRFSITSQNVESNDTIPSALLQVELANPLFDLSLSQKASRQFVLFGIGNNCNFPYTNTLHMFFTPDRGGDALALLKLHVRSRTS